MTRFDPTAEPLDDADWQAVRYVLGELAHDETAAFVTWLADDQVARDALVRATQLVETLAVTPWPAKSVAVAQRKRLPRIVAAIVATAAALAMCAVAYRNVSHDVAPRLAVDEIDPGQLVALWTASATSLNGIADADFGDEGAALDPQASLLPPDWLLAAVEHEALAAPAMDPTGDLESETIERN